MSSEDADADADLLPLLRIRDGAEFMEQLLAISADYFATRMTMDEFAAHRWDLLQDFARDPSGKWTTSERAASVREMRDKGLVTRDEASLLLLKLQNIRP